MTSKPNTNLDTDETLIETLSQLSSGEINLDEAAIILETDMDSLAELIESSPRLVEQADARANQRKLDPSWVVSKSHQGLSAAVTVLADRIQREGNDMPVSELVAASKVLESLIAFSKQRENELKSDQVKGDPGLPLIVQDTRQNGLRIFLVPPDSPQWIDTRKEEFQAPKFSWLEQFVPLNDAGEVVNTEKLLAGGNRYMDDQGRVFGAN